MRDISYLTNSYDEKTERIKKLKAPLNFVFSHAPLHNEGVFAPEGENGGRYIFTV